MYAVEINEQQYGSQYVSKPSSFQPIGNKTKIQHW